jgi:hypothetical protein
MGKIFENLFKNPQSQKKIQIYWQGDLMAIKKSTVACVHKRNISPNMTRVSDVAPGPLVILVDGISNK